MSTMTQAEFARLHGVSRKTVTEWKGRGYLVMSEGRVAVEASNARLSTVGRSRLDPVTQTAATVRTIRQVAAAKAAGNGTLPEQVLHQHAADYPAISILASVIDGAAIDITEALMDRIPFAELRPIVEGIIAKIRRGAVECLDEEVAPPGLRTWAAHPWFTRPPLAEPEWLDLQAEASAPPASPPRHHHPETQRSASHGRR